MSELLKTLLAPYFSTRMRIVEEGAGGDAGGDGEGEGEGGNVDLNGGDAVGSGNQERLNRLSAIADQNDIENEQEMGDVNDDGTTTPFRAERPAGEESPTGEEEEKKEEIKEEEAPKEAAPKKFKLKVNGKDLELTEEELIARAQKVESADEYLREAKSRAALPKKEEPSAEEIQRQQDAEDAELVRAIQMGTPEEATAALRKLRTQATAAHPSITVDDVSRTIDERLEFKTAIETYEKEFADLVADPLLSKLVRDKDKEQLAAGDDRPYLDRYRAIGTEIREWVGKVAPKPEEVKEDGLETKRAAKASAPKLPVMASAKAKKQEPEDEQDESTGNVIAKMREQRGGPQWMRN